MSEQFSNESNEGKYLDFLNSDNEIISLLKKKNTEIIIEFNDNDPMTLNKKTLSIPFKSYYNILTKMFGYDVDSMEDHCYNNLICLVNEDKSYSKSIYYPEYMSLLNKCQSFYILFTKYGELENNNNFFSNINSDKIISIPSMSLEKICKLQGSTLVDMSDYYNVAVFLFNEEDLKKRQQYLDRLKIRTIIFDRYKQYESKKKDSYIKIESFREISNEAENMINSKGSSYSIKVNKKLNFTSGENSMNYSRPNNKRLSGFKSSLLNTSEQNTGHFPIMLSRTKLNKSRLSSTKKYSFKESVMSSRRKASAEPKSLKHNFRYTTSGKNKTEFINITQTFKNNKENIDLNDDINIDLDEELDTIKETSLKNSPDKIKSDIYLDRYFTTNTDTNLRKLVSYKVVNILKQINEEGQLPPNLSVFDHEGKIISLSSKGKDDLLNADENNYYLKLQNLKGKYVFIHISSLKSAIENDESTEREYYQCLDYLGNNEAVKITQNIRDNIGTTKPINMGRIYYIKINKRKKIKEKVINK